MIMIIIIIIVLIICMITVVLGLWSYRDYGRKSNISNNRDYGRSG